AATGTARGQHVLIAWDGSREATRAIHAALPFLDHAGQVTLLTVHATSDQPPRDRIAGADIADTLAHHGVTGRVRELSVDKDTPVGAPRLAQAFEWHCDLIV